MRVQDHVIDIRRISDRISIVSNDEYTLANKLFSVANQQAYTKWHQPLGTFGQNNAGESQLRNHLQNQLAGSIYATFYCRGTTEKGDLPAEAHLQKKISHSDHQKTIQALSDANTTIGGIDPVWTVYFIDPQGTVFVHKNGNLRYLVSHEWEFASNTETNLKIGSVVNLKMRKEDRMIQPVFYHVRSAAMVPQQGDFIRIYFHTEFDGALLLVEQITSVYNAYKVPFQFKCLNHPELFNRTDSAVLYLDKAHICFDTGLLRLILPQIRPYLKPEVPLFTKMVEPGISFSEDPGNGQSFGMSRCLLIAEGIVNAFYKGASDKEKQLDEIMKVFWSNGIDPAKIHLKPHSKFPYHFSLLTSPHATHKYNNHNSRCISQPVS